MTNRRISPPTFQLYANHHVRTFRPRTWVRPRRVNRTTDPHCRPLPVPDLQPPIPLLPVAPAAAVRRPLLPLPPPPTIRTYRTVQAQVQAQRHRRRHRRPLPGPGLPRWPPDHRPRPPLHYHRQYPQMPSSLRSPQRCPRSSRARTHRTICGKSLRWPHTIPAAG